MSTNDSIDWNDEEQRQQFIQQQIDSVVNQQVTGLKAKNQELLDKIAKSKTGTDELQKTFELLGGEEGAKSLIDLKKRVESDERMKKIMSGEISQIQEVIDAETSMMKKNFENQLNATGEKLSVAEKQVLELQKKIQTSALKSLVSTASSELGCLPGTAEDIFRHALNVFEWDNELSQHVIKKNGIIQLGEDGKTPMSIKDWLDSTREECAYRWPQTRGGNSLGSGPGFGDGSWSADNMSMDQYRRLRQGKK